jgi:hypothetical protein
VTRQHSRQGTQHSDTLGLGDVADTHLKYKGAALCWVAVLRHQVVWTLARSLSRSSLAVVY